MAKVTEDDIVSVFGRMTDPPHVVAAATTTKRKKKNLTKEKSVARTTTEKRVQAAIKLFDQKRSWGREELKEQGISNPSEFFQRPIVNSLIGTYAGIHIREKVRTGKFEARTIGSEGVSLITGSHSVSGDYFWYPEESWLIENALRARKSVCLVGPAGCGKSTLLKLLIQKVFGVDPYEMSLNGEMSVSDFFGVRALRNGSTEWDEGPITLAMQEKRPIIVDELDAAPPEILYCMYRVLEKPKPVHIPTFADDEGNPLILDPWNDGEAIVPKTRTNKKTGATKIVKVKQKVKSKFTIACTANTTGRGDDSGMYRGAQVLNEAFLDRYSLFLRLDYPPVDAETEVLVRRVGIKRTLARKIATVAHDARQALKDAAKLNCTFSVRRTLNWAESVKHLGCSVEQGFVASVMSRASVDDAEALAEVYQRTFSEVPSLKSITGKTSVTDPFTV